jgi:hypothetical protein
VLLQSDEEGLLSSFPDSPISPHEKLQEHDSLPESPIGTESEALYGDVEKELE